MSPTKLPTYYETTQGYVLVTHGRKHVWCAMLRLLNGDRQQQQRALFEFGREATPAEELFKNKEEHLKEPVVVKAVGLSASGFKRLGLNYEKFTPAFRGGFKNSFPEVGTPGDFDAIIVLASDDEEALRKQQSQIREAFGTKPSIYWEYGYIEKVKLETGSFLRLPFGYLDGISSPELTFHEPRAASIEEAAVPAQWDKNWDEAKARAYVLYADPSVPDSFGSYMAFLKIRQDVQAFDALMAAVADKIGENEELVKAWVMGRSLTGEPLEPEEQGYKTGNNFNYNGDTTGQKCPYAAHIRKVNPRDSSEKNHQILRRSAVYGDMDDPDRGECGLLFQCFQSTLEMGFEYILKNWARNADHPIPGCGPDALLGDGRDWPPQPEGFSPGQNEIRKFTQILYGEYFYFPPIPFFSQTGEKDELPTLEKSEGIKTVQEQARRL
jgi:Dyp-type peroxidase family